ncbi:protein tyrosine kinase [Gordonia alkanivorans]|uniref:YveK family protein n=1 Tax=Gordonia alkanivorans TaxID=84096 RepID=UPI000FDE1F93|nr:protein tyrosine kinase [Gordonia alkanivorans]AZZ83929.1 protein tyrosine kinase [Gordonia alkanivorans]
MRSPSTRRPADYLAMVRRNLVVLVASAIAAAAVGVGAYTLMPKTFEAHSSALIIAPGPASVGAERASDLAGQLRSASYVQLAVSDQVLSRVARAGAAGVLGDTVTPDELRDLLTVTSPLDSAVLDVVATGPTGEAAAHLANAVVDVLRVLVTELEWSDGPVAGPLHEIDVIDVASVPNSSVLPRFWGTVTTAAVLGALLGLMLVIGVEVARDRVVDPREARVPRASDAAPGGVSFVGASGGGM